MTPSKERQIRTSEFLGNLKAIGLYSAELEKRVMEFYDDPTGSPALKAYVLGQGQQVAKFELMAEFTENGTLSLDHFALMLPKQYAPVAKISSNGVDSHQLEKEMRAIDWSKHPGSFNIADYRTYNPKLSEMDTLLKDLYWFEQASIKHHAEEQKAVREVVDALIGTYLRSTPLENFILQQAPERKEIFYDVFPFPPQMHSSHVLAHLHDRKELNKLSQSAFSINFKNKTIMNLNNLEDLKDEMKMLGFKDKLITQMEENMKKDVPEFKLHDTINGTKGRVDLTLHFKQSGQSEFYYLNRFEAAQNKGKALEEGQKYWVILPPKDGKPQIKGLEHASEAIELFKAQKGDSELSIGKAFDGSGKVAIMENGKVNYVAKDFQSTYYSQNLPQTFWVDHGKGFTAEQAVNLVQGRAVYRDDLLSRDGVPYKAWMQLDTDKARDRHNNLSFKQFNDPSYGFDLGKVLDSFKIRETEDPAKLEKLETALRNGNRPLVTAVKDGQEVKLYVEAAVRYGKLNFYDMEGKPEKREILMKETAVSHSLSNGKAKEQQQTQSQGMRM